MNKKLQQVSLAELEQYLHQQIPLSRGMGVSIVSINKDSITLRAPLAPNINHRQTVFGGSASAVAILAAWLLLHTRLQNEGLADRLVIQRNTMEYERPIMGEFTAKSSLKQPDEWPAFTRVLANKRKARIAVLSVLEHDGRVAGRFHGEFVALSA